MQGRPKWEVLVGDMRTLDFLAPVPEPYEEHPLQTLVEEFLTTISEAERELFYMRFGEGMPIRSIARRLGYSSHQIIQLKIANIVEKAREYLVARQAAEGDRYRSL